MVQVLHLTSTTADLQADRTAAAIRRAAAESATGGDGNVAIVSRTIGRGGHYRNAAQAAMSLRFGRGTLFDVVHAFDVPSMVAACAGPSPPVFSPSGPPAIAPGVLSAAMVYRNGAVIANTHALRRRLVAGGVPAPRCDVIPPPVELRDVAARPDRESSFRAALGLAPDDRRVVLAPGESTLAAGHLLALHAVSILHVLDPRVRLLVWGRGPALPHLRHLAASLRQPGVLIVAEDRVGRAVPFEQLAASSDFALVTPTGLPPSLPLAACMAAGLPIVAGAGGIADEWLADGRTASVTPTLAPRLIAQRLLHLMEDPSRAAALGRTARAEATRQFDPRARAAQFLALYRRVAGVALKGERSPEVESGNPPVATRV